MPEDWTEIQQQRGFIPSRGRTPGTATSAVKGLCMTTVSVIDTGSVTTVQNLLQRLLVPDPPPFALIRRCTAREGPVELLLGEVTEFASIAALPLPGPGSEGSAAPRMLAVVPYRQVSERGYACNDDAEPIRVLAASQRAVIPARRILPLLPRAEVDLRGGSFDIGDADYARIVERIIENEIRSGEGSNFVIRRSFRGVLHGYRLEVALAVFRRLLAAEKHAYWTFVVHTGDRTFVGASPEQHVHVAGGVVQMTPISGTYRYQSTGPDLGEVLQFLGDQKETDELCMVLDEELKMMARVCDGGVRVRGPYLREMARLAHTEYRLRGRTSMDVRHVLRETMFAPTVIGSPLENACRVIARNEPDGRGYYSGAVALLGTDDVGRPWLDSAILIRTAEIRRSGALRADVGATLVRHSRPAAEVAETWAKAEALLGALGARPRPGGPGRGRAVRRGLLAAHPEVAEVLQQRNAGLSSFWLARDDAATELGGLPALGRVLVVDAEDMFTGMLGQQMRALGLDVTIWPCACVTPERAAEFDCVVLGPGPGDPRAGTDPRIARLRELIDALLARRAPFLGECLSHQLLADALGLPLVKRQVPNQGAQLQLDLFGQQELVGFYNSYEARYAGDRPVRGPDGDEVEVCRDERTGEVHALRGAGFASTQFHLESVLTSRGTRILAGLMTWVARRQGAATTLAQGGAD
jgi:2-amino-4-deoxychorismate synthase